MHNKLDAAIRNRLAARKGGWLEIAERAGVSHSWMSKFMNGHIKNPGIRTLEKLDQALKPRTKAVNQSQTSQELALPSDPATNTQEA